MRQNAQHESMQFLIDRGIDMTIKDYRWKMAHWLEEAERQREQGR